MPCNTSHDLESVTGIIADVGNYAFHDSLRDCPFYIPGKPEHINELSLYIRFDHS